MDQDGRVVAEARESDSVQEHGAQGAFNTQELIAQEIDDAQEESAATKRADSHNAVAKKGAQHTGKEGVNPRASQRDMRHALKPLRTPSRVDLPPDKALWPLAFCGMALSSIAVLCAEPGMGKTQLVRQLAHNAAEEGWDVFCYSFAGEDSAHTCSKLVRTCREVGYQVGDTPALLVADSVTVGDECEVAREVRAIRKIVERGVRVVLCLRPESEQLIDALGDCQCLRSEELLFRSADALDDSWNLTGGIPELMYGLQGDRALGLAESRSPRYLEALVHVVHDCLRPELAEEDQRVRLAAILLGHGTLDELAIVSGRCDYEMLGLLHRDVVLMGIDLRARAFCCYGVDDDARFSVCLGMLQAHAAAFPSVVTAACGTLAVRGQMARSAAVCSLCPTSADFVSMGIPWGVAYTLAGEAPLVIEALRTAHQLGAPRSASLCLSEAAVASVTGTFDQVDEAFKRLDAHRLATSRERDMYHNATLLAACRASLRNPRTGQLCLGVMPHNERGIGCLDHLRVMRLLCDGSFTEAYATITNELLVAGVSDVSSALLCDDLYLALMLSGGVPDAREQKLFNDENRFLAKSGLVRMQTYHRAIVSLADVLMGPETAEQPLEEGVAAADKAQDRYLQAVFLLGLAVRDLRGHALPRAHVRAERAGDLAREADEEYLASSAEFVDALVREQLGEPGALAKFCEHEKRPKGLALLAHLALLALGEARQEDWDTFSITTSPCPRDVLWALNVIMHDAGSLSEMLVGRIPASWVEVVQAVRVRQEVQRRGQERKAKGEKPRPSAPTRPSLGEGVQTQLLARKAEPRRVRVRVLGSFDIEAGGKMLPKNYLGRRRAIDFVQLLALIPEHRLLRYRIGEALWPGSTPRRALRKVYEATGEVRSGLASLLEGKDPIVCENTQGLVGLDTALIAFDVDEFELEARAVLTADGDDFGVLSHARAMEQLFGTGPLIHLAAPGDRLLGRINELETLYVDAAVAAGEAALRLGKAKLAVRYGMDAQRFDDVREDVMLLVSQALRAAGRPYEVMPLFRRYTERLMEVEGTPPSLSLRRAIAQATGDGPEPLIA